MPVKIDLAASMCTDALKVLSEESESAHTYEICVNELDALANARYALSAASEFLYKSCVVEEKPWTDVEIRAPLGRFLDAVQALCTKTPTNAPAVFLLKQLVRRYGVDALNIGNQEHLRWIIPPESRRIQVTLQSNTAM